MVAVVILAAGRSSRMGTSKALLRHPKTESTFVAHAIREARIAGLEQVFIVGRISDEKLRSEVDSEGATFLINDDPDRGQLSSLIVGIDAAEAHGQVDAVLVVPVDVPLVSAKTIRTLLDRAATVDAAILRATSNGVHGHPVLFKRAVFDELRRADPSLGARAVVRADPRRVENVEMGDDGVTIDVDFPEDYARLFNR